MNEVVGLRAKTLSNLNEKNDEDTKEKDTKKWVIKRKLKFQDYKNDLEVVQIKTK